MQNVFTRRNSLTGVHNTRGGKNRCMTGTSTWNKYDSCYSCLFYSHDHAFGNCLPLWRIMVQPMVVPQNDKKDLPLLVSVIDSLLWSTACLIIASNLPSSTCHKTQCLTRLYILGNYCQNQIINVCWPVTSGWCNELFNNIYISGYLSPVATLTCTFNLWLFIVEWMWHRNRWCCLTCITLIFYYCFFLWWCQMCTQAANSSRYRENDKLQHTPFKISGSNSHIDF